MHSPQTDKDERDAMSLAMSLALNLGFLIAVPAFVFGFGGAMLDKEWGTTPYLTVAGLVFSFILSAFSVVRRTRSILSRSAGRGP